MRWLRCQERQLDWVQSDVCLQWIGPGHPPAILQWWSESPFTMLVKAAIPFVVTSASSLLDAIQGFCANHAMLNTIGSCHSWDHWTHHHGSTACVQLMPFCSHLEWALSWWNHPTQQLPCLTSCNCTYSGHTSASSWHSHFHSWPTHLPNPLGMRREHPLLLHLVHLQLCESFLHLVHLLVCCSPCDPSLSFSCSSLALMTTMSPLASLAISCVYCNK